MRTTTQLAADATRVWELLAVQREVIVPDRAWAPVLLVLVALALVAAALITLFGDNVTRLFAMSSTCQY